MSAAQHNGAAATTALRLVTQGDNATVPGIDADLDLVQVGAGQLAACDLIGLIAEYGNFSCQVSGKLRLGLREGDSGHKCPNG